MKSSNKFLKQLFIMAIVFGGVITLVGFIKEYLLIEYASKIERSEADFSSIVQFLEPTSDKVDPFDFNAPKLIGNAVILSGSSVLKLSEGQIAIGVAESFPDVQESVFPPITIFVIYGAANISVSLKNGMWDVWDNASEEFILGKTSEKIEQVNEIYSDVVLTRGYRLIECYSQVSYCTVLESTSPQ